MLQCSRGREQGDIAYAQAMFYAANESNPSGRRDILQTNTSWDTLQWTPPVQAPEWWKQPDKGGRSFYPTAFIGQQLLPSAHSQLNWQAKLVPLTPARISQVEKEQKWIMKHTNLLTH